MITSMHARLYVGACPPPLWPTKRLTLNPRFVSFAPTFSRVQTRISSRIFPQICCVFLPVYEGVSALVFGAGKMVKLGNNFTEKGAGKMVSEDGFDTIPLITPLDASQLQFPPPDKVKSL